MQNHTNNNTRVTPSNYQPTKGGSFLLLLLINSPCFFVLTPRFSGHPTTWKIPLPFPIRRIIYFTRRNSFLGPRTITKHSTITSMRAIWKAVRRDDVQERQVGISVMKSSAARLEVNLVALEVFWLLIIATFSYHLVKLILFISNLKATKSKLCAFHQHPNLNRWILNQYLRKIFTNVSIPRWRSLLSALKPKTKTHRALVLIEKDIGTFFSAISTFNGGCFHSFHRATCWFSISS